MGSKDADTVEVMREFEVHVLTTVKETYYVKALSAEEAEDKWSDVGLSASECLSVLDVTVLDREG